MVVPSAWPALWAMRAWVCIFILVGIGMASVDPVEGPLLAVAGYLIFGAADSLWTWVKLGGNSILISAESVVFHQRFGRDIRVPLNNRRRLIVERTGGFLSYVSPAYAEFASVRVDGTYAEMEFLAFTNKQLDELRLTLNDLLH